MRGSKFVEMKQRLRIAITSLPTYLRYDSWTILGFSKCKIGIRLKQEDQEMLLKGCLMRDLMKLGMDIMEAVLREVLQNHL